MQAMSPALVIILVNGSQGLIGSGDLNGSKVWHQLE